jgi:plasmid stabilization system protein ParE
MNYTVRFSEAAERDIVELLDYLVPLAGERISRAYVDRLIDYCAGFEVFPERGLGREDISSGLRIVGYNRKATIAFRVKNDAVTIIRIFHGGRDIDWTSLE